MASVTITITVTTTEEGHKSSFHSDIPHKQSWDDTKIVMQLAQAEFQRQFDEQSNCPFHPK